MVQNNSKFEPNVPVKSLSDSKELLFNASYFSSDPPPFASPLVQPKFLLKVPQSNTPSSSYSSSSSSPFGVPTRINQRAIRINTQSKKETKSVSAKTKANDKSNDYLDEIEEKKYKKKLIFDSHLASSCIGDIGTNSFILSFYSFFIFVLSYN